MEWLQLMSRKYVLKYACNTCQDTQGNIRLTFAKLIVNCWLVIPHFSGAVYVYEHYVRPFYVGK
ncbi:hypothetical protein HanHA300_Chr03g0074811 [Helianthus annuus]|nr:hypothetical protein HanIR_Chr12g0613131 [Helianthus annuus]KAJ0591574.1 hypothetical protein HanHA300_Chr03g0074811 [Helianthus annuus]KAJ0772459.1 hypothetical protein HanOQP8_Chr03g0087561 [Helianthus annuus]